MAKFPSGFFWGAATASYQVEGGIENNDWAEGAREGKVPVCGRSTDHYNRFEADFDIAKSLGHNAHRFSIEWSRIEPEDGKFDEKEIEHYRKVIQALKSRGLEPFVTLWHFTLPVWFSKRGGFQNKDAPEIFARYCSYVVERLGGEVKYWMTMNEPLVWLMWGYVRGGWPPFKKEFYSFFSIQSSLEDSHIEAFKRIKAMFPMSQVGIAKHNVFYTNNGAWWANIASRFMNWFWNERFLNAIVGHQDFIGLNHYFYKEFGSKEILPKSDMGWDIKPKAIYGCLMDLRKYNLPIYVTENGIADAKDEKRPGFIRDYISNVELAIKDGADVKGYFYWSLLDNYEWSFGFSKRFGLVEIDYETMERKIRPSALIYKKIAENNVL